MRPHPPASPLPLLLRGRWLYRFDPRRGWMREALDEPIVERLNPTRRRRLEPLLLRQLRRGGGLGPSAVQALARAAERAHGLPALEALNPRLPPCPLPARLVEYGHDRYGRLLRLAPAAAHALNRMRRAAAAEGIVIEVVSGFRSPGYQAGLWQRKLAGGQALAKIAKVSAAPGQSEHHSGRALDLASGSGPALEASFARTPAYRWLRRHAARFGFVESYPRGNACGVIAEPWHWCHRSG